MTKRSLIFKSVLFLLLFCVSCTLFAVKSGDWEYEATSKTTAKITKYYNNQKTVEIPSDIDGYKVTSIGPKTFRSGGWSYIFTSIIIPDTVISIDDEAFESCSSLTSITIPKSVRSIGERAFYNCQRLTDITISEGVTSIGKWAFNDCASLTSITIPSSVSSIGHAAFIICRSLLEINVADGNQDYSSQDGVLFNHDGSELIFYPEGRIGEYTIPDSVYWIADLCFSNSKNVTSIKIPERVNYIGDIAVYSNNLAFIEVSENNKSFSSVDGVLFDYDKTKLIQYPPKSDFKEYIIPNGVKTISVMAFCNCSNLISITIPDSVTVIEESVFISSSNLKYIVIPSSVTSIGKWAFSGVNREELVIFTPKGSYAESVANEYGLKVEYIE